MKNWILVLVAVLVIIMSTTVNANGTSVCGNSICEEGELFNCSKDCVLPCEPPRCRAIALPFCGDGICNLDETWETCSDCERPTPPSQPEIRGTGGPMCPDSLYNCTEWNECSNNTQFRDCSKNCSDHFPMQGDIELGLITKTEKRECAIAADIATECEVCEECNYTLTIPDTPVIIDNTTVEPEIEESPDYSSWYVIAGILLILAFIIGRFSKK